MKTFATANNTTVARSVGRVKPTQARQGGVGQGKARRGNAGLAWHGASGPGLAWTGVATQAWLGKDGPGAAWQGNAGLAWHGGARPGKATQAWQGMARTGLSRRGTSRHKPGGATGVKIALTFSQKNTNQTHQYDKPHRTRTRGINPQ